jgi:SAM-dependent methyltransferase
LRESIKEFVRIAVETLPFEEPVFEFGSLQVPGQEGFADLRPLFRGKQYIGCDVREGAGVDRIADLHNLDMPSGSVGTVLVLDTLEHVEFPRKAMDETHRVLQAGGIVVISSVMRFPIHEHPHDYWRFTPQGFESLLGRFPQSFVGFAGDEAFPHTVVGVGFKDLLPSLDRFVERYERWKQQCSSTDDEEQIRALKEWVAWLEDGIRFRDGRIEDLERALHAAERGLPYQVLHRLRAILLSRRR